MLNKWKRSKTYLKVTVLTGDEKPDIHTGEVFAVDSDACLVSILVRGTRDFFTLDLSGATFNIGKRKLEAAREGTDDFLLFEEH